MRSYSLGDYDMMTEQERKEARREASRKCYLKRKAMLDKKPNKKRPCANKPPADDMKAAEKLVKKFSRPAAEMKVLIKEAAEVLKSAYQSENEKTVSKIRRMFEKNLSLAVGEEAVEHPNGKFKRALFFNIGEKHFAVPRPFKKDAAEENPGYAPRQDDLGEDGDETAKELPTDPDEIKKIVELNEAPDGGMDAEAVPADDNEELDEYDERQDGDADEDDADEDEFELTDDEKERRRWREEKALDDDYASGRADAMRELGAQGWGEED